MSSLSTAGVSSSRDNSHKYNRPRADSSNVTLMLVVKLRLLRWDYGSGHLSLIRGSALVVPVQTPKARRKASGRMGQIGILAKVGRQASATASPQCRDKMRHRRRMTDRLARPLLPEWVRLGRSMETSSVTRELRSIIGVTDTPVLADGSFVRYSDNFVVGGFSAASRERKSSGNHCREPNR
jgi:hypothetical protein